MVVCAASGFLTAVVVCRRGEMAEFDGGCTRAARVGVRGVVLGLVYGLNFIWQWWWILWFPIIQVGFKMFLGVMASVAKLYSKGTCYCIVLEDNPLVYFVELPDTCQGLYDCNIMSGVIRGALEMVLMKTEVTSVRDVLHGDDAYELRVKPLKQVPECPYKDVK